MQRRTTLTEYMGGLDFVKLFFRCSWMFCRSWMLVPPPTLLECSIVVHESAIPLGHGVRSTARTYRQKDAESPTDLQKLRNGDKLFSAGPSASARMYSPSMPLRAFLPHMPPMMRASTCATRGTGGRPVQYPLLPESADVCMT